MKKSIVSFIVIIVMLSGSLNFSFAAPYQVRLENTIILYLNNNTAYVNGFSRMIVGDNEQIKPVAVNQSTIIPIRFIAENLGAVVGWDNLIKTVSIKLNNDTLFMQIDNKEILLNEKKHHSSVAPCIIDSTTYVPLRIVSELLDKNVFYDRGVIIISEKNNEFDPVKDKPIVDYFLDKYNQRTKRALSEIAKLDDSVVMVYTHDAVKKTIATGSGFCVHDGLFVTNMHVLSMGKSWSIETESGKQYDIDGIVAFDAMHDIALVKTVENPGVKPLTLGSIDTMQKGEQIVAIGSPYGLKNTVLDGIVSGLSKEGATQIIQITAPITSGSSGGPLFNMYGEVVGITTFGIKDEENFNFCIAADHLEHWQTWYFNKPFTHLFPLQDERCEKDPDIRDEDLFSIINKNIEAYNHKDIDGYLDTVIVINSDRQELLKNLNESFDESVDLTIEVVQNKVFMKNSKEALIETIQVGMDSISKKSIACNELMYLKNVNGKWKIMDSDILSFNSTRDETAGTEDISKQEKQGLNSIDRYAVTDLVAMNVDSIVIGDYKTNKVFILNPITDTIINEYQLDAAPEKIDYDPETKIIAVTQYDKNEIVLINVNTGVIDYVETTGKSMDLCFGNNNQIIVITKNTIYDKHYNNLNIIDVKTKAEVFCFTDKNKTIDDFNLIAYDKKSDQIFLASSGTSPATLYRCSYNPETFEFKKLQGNLSLGANGQDLDVSPNGSHVAFCTGGGNSNFTLYDIDSGDITSRFGSWDLGMHNRTAAFSKDNVYLVAFDGEHVKVFSVATHTLIKAFDAGRSSIRSGIDVAPANGYIYLFCTNIIEKVGKIYYWEMSDYLVVGQQEQNIHISMIPQDNDSKYVQ